MILDQKDGELLKLVGLCRYLPVTLKNKYTNEALFKSTTDALREYGLIKLTTDKQCYKLTSIGRGVLQEMGFTFRADARSVVGDDPRYMRRMMCADINVMFHTAGVNVFTETAQELNKCEIGYLPLLNVRSKERASLFAARMAGVFRGGDVAYAVYYMSDETEGVHIGFERSTLRQLTKGITGIKHTKIIFAGKSLEELWKLIFETKGPRRLPNETTPFALAYDDFVQNVLFVERSRNGALQAQILAAPDYRKKLADHFCRGRTSEPATLSHCDGFHKGVPVIIAADMDLKRLRAAIRQAEINWRTAPEILCLDFQERVLQRFLEYYNVPAARIYKLTFEEVTAMMPGIGKREFTNEPFRTVEGGCISVQ